MKTTIALGFVTLLVACGAGGGAPEPVEPESDDTESVTDQDTDTPDDVAPVASLPADFEITSTGGPVRAASEGVNHTRAIGPRPDAAGEFDLGLTTAEYNMLEPGEPAPPEITRVPVPVDRVAAIYELIRSRRGELSGPCMDPTIMDGATSGYHVVAGGEQMDFRCTNASTPAFSALSEAFNELVQEFSPAE